MPSSFHDLINESIDTDFSINGDMQWILSTDFSIEDFNAILEKYKEMEYPIILEDGKPVVKDGELVRDINDFEAREHNNQIGLYRIASQLKLIVKNTDIHEMDVEEIINVLKNTSLDIFIQLQSELSKIIHYKFNVLPKLKNQVARKALAYSINEKKEREIYLKEIAKQRDELFKVSDEIQIKLQEAYDKVLELELQKVQKQIDELSDILNTDSTDGIRIENGITENYLLLECAKEFNWDVAFQIRALKHEINREEEAYIELCKAKYSLTAERDERMYKKSNVK